MENLPISVFVIAKDEADRIPLTIESVRDWVDEVIVIDSGSADDTVAVAEALGARVEFREWTPCLHYTWRDVGHYMEKINSYSSMQAEHQPLKPFWFLVIQLVLGIPLDFIKAYLLRRHITGGSFGVIVSGMFVISRFLKNAKMIERHLRNRGC
jgi:glycosyltransferase involved in cell wall biosynthesis